MKNSDDERIIYRRKNGDFLPYVRMDKFFFSYLFKRSLQFTFDILLFIVILYLLEIFFDSNIWFNYIYILLAHFFIGFLSIIFFGGRSIGMMFSGLYITKRKGSEPGLFDFFTRYISATIFLLPLPLAWMFTIPLSALITLLTRGASFVDAFSATLILEKHKYIAIHEITNNEGRG